MIFLYSFVLLTIGSLKWVVQRRATALGRRYSTLVKQIQQMLSQAPLRQGNTNRPDACQAARHQLELGLLVTRRDRLETKHFAWQRSAERLAGVLNRLRAWKGQKLPYTLGVADVWLALTVVDQLGVGEIVSPRQVLTLVMSLLQQ